jgi:hypothetical protein
VDKHEANLKLKSKKEEFLPDLIEVEDNQIRVNSKGSREFKLGNIFVRICNLTKSSTDSVAKPLKIVMFFDKLMKSKQKTDKKLYLKYKTQNMIHEAMASERLQSMVNLVEFFNTIFDPNLKPFSHFCKIPNLP